MAKSSPCNFGQKSFIFDHHFTQKTINFISITFRLSIKFWNLTFSTEFLFFPFALKFNIFTFKVFVRRMLFKTEVQNQNTHKMQRPPPGQSIGSYLNWLPKTTQGRTEYEMRFKNQFASSPPCPWAMSAWGTNHKLIKCNSKNYLPLNVQHWFLRFCFFKQKSVNFSKTTQKQKIHHEAKKVTKDTRRNEKKIFS